MQQTILKTQLCIFFLVLAFPLNLWARNHYYPTSFQNEFKNLSGSSRGTSSRVELSSGEIKELLFNVLNQMHQKHNGAPDTLGCQGGQKAEKNCYRHQSLGYRTARKELFGNIHLEKDSDGYFIEDVYCGKKITKEDTKVGPGIIPDNHILNAEHTWPQSRFSRKFSNDLQKSDLHHLYPTDSRANSKRGNFEFANVDGKEVADDCRESKFGRSRDRLGRLERFEPPTEHKGNVARAIFYFSIRYQIALSPSEEAYLREWHELDPVDSMEMQRNDEIHKLQGNRNPFIDYPELVGLIQKF